MFAENELHGWSPDLFWKKRQIDMRVFQDAVLVHAGLGAKDVAADDSLGGGWLDTRQPGDESAELIELLRVNSALDRIFIGVDRNRHNHFFEGRISGPLSQTVHRALHDIHTLLDAGKRIGGAQA